MSAYLMHTDPEVYPEPFSFIPERWLGDIHPNMNRNFVPFCRGMSILCNYLLPS
jgi:cytochrome P450